MPLMQVEVLHRGVAASLIALDVAQVVARSIAHLYVVKHDVRADSVDTENQEGGCSRSAVEDWAIPGGRAIRGVVPSFINRNRNRVARSSAPIPIERHVGISPNVTTLEYECVAGDWGVRCTVRSTACHARNMRPRR